MAVCEPTSALKLALSCTGLEIQFAGACSARLPDDHQTLEVVHSRVLQERRLKTLCNHISLYS